jgi:hypothetical protein
MSNWPLATNFLTDLFKLWWDKQTAEMKKSVKKLVANGQFEIINGGWSMNDEACPYYEEIIDNMQTGIEWINKELGFSSYIGWHWIHSVTHLLMLESKPNLVLILLFSVELMKMTELKENTIKL